MKSVTRGNPRAGGPAGDGRDPAGVCDRLFGTDGIRGVAGQDLTAWLAMDLSVAAAAVLGHGARTGSARPGRAVAVVGRDPRASGEFLEAAVVAGLASAAVSSYPAPPRTPSVPNNRPR